jgi:hypothetical protein
MQGVGDSRDRTGVATGTDRIDALVFTCSRPNPIKYFLPNGTVGSVPFAENG